MVLQLDGKIVPKIFMGNSKIYDVEELTEPKLVKDESLILHYDFSQGDNNAEDRGVIKDLSGNGNDGVLHNFDYSEESGYVENGLRFDGIDDTITFEEIFFDTETDNFTVEISMEVHNDPDVGRETVIGSQSSSSYNSGSIIYTESYSSSTRRFRGIGTGFSTYISSDKYHYVIKNSNSVSTVLLNSEHRPEIKENKKVEISQIGAIGVSSSLGSNYFFQGVISGIRIYNRALSEKELTNNYIIDSNKYFGVPFPEPPESTQLKLGQKDISLIYKGDKVVFPNHTQDGLKLWYDFSSMSTDPDREFRVKDLSGNGNDGSLANFKFDGTDGYMNKGLMFNGEGSEVNFPKMTFKPEENWTVEIVLDKSTRIKPNGRLFGDKTNNSYITFSMDEQYSWTRYGQIKYMSNDFTSSYIDMNETSPDFVHMIVSKKDGVVSTITGDNPNVIDTVTVEHEQNFDNLGFASRYSNLDYAFKGLVHSVRVYDRALTQEEITQNYKLDKARYGI